MLHSSSKKIIKSKEKNPEIKSLLNSHSQLYNIRTNFPIAIKHCEPLEINQTRYKNCDLNPCELLWANDANEIVSNGRLIEYSDGTTQIVIGKHIFEVKKHLLSKKIFFCADFFLDKSEKNNQSDYMDSKTDLKSSGDLSLTEVLCDIGQMMVLQNKKVKPNFKAAKEVEKPKTRKIEAHELKTTEELFEDVEQLRRRERLKVQRLKAAQRGQRKLSTGKVEFTKDFLEEDLSEEDQSDFSENESVDSSEEKDESMNFQQSSFSSDGESVSEAEFD